MVAAAAAVDSCLWGRKGESLCVCFFVNPCTGDSGGFGEEFMALLDLSPPPPLPLSAPGTADV